MGIRHIRIDVQFILDMLKETQPQEFYVKNSLPADAKIFRSPNTFIIRVQSEEYSMSTDNEIIVPEITRITLKERISDSTTNAPC